MCFEWYWVALATALVIATATFTYVEIGKGFLGDQMEQIGGVLFLPLGFPIALCLFYGRRKNAADKTARELVEAVAQVAWLTKKQREAHDELQSLYKRIFDLERAKRK